MPSEQDRRRADPEQWLVLRALRSRAAPALPQRRLLLAANALRPRTRHRRRCCTAFGRKSIDGYAQFDSTREQQIAAFKVLQHQLSGVRQYAGFVFQRLERRDVGPVFGPVISECLAGTSVPFRLKHLLDLPDLADEETVHFFRQHPEHKAVVLISRPDERPQVGLRQHMHTVGQWHRNRDLAPQTNFLQVKNAAPRPSAGSSLARAFSIRSNSSRSSSRRRCSPIRFQRALSEARQNGCRQAPPTRRSGLSCR